MTRRPDDGMEPPEPFGQDGELARLLRAERSAPEPDGATRDRMWSRLSGSLMVPPALRPLGVGKLVVVAAVVGAVATFAWWRTRPVTAPVAPGVLESPVAAPNAPATSVPAPTAPAPPPPTLGELAEAESAKDVRRPRPRPTDSLGEERRLVDGARDALAHGRPHEAYDMLDEHAHRFARGQLAEERESLSIRSELTLGRPADARDRSRAFLRRYPDSLFAPIVRALGDRATAAAPIADE